MREDEIARLRIGKRARIIRQERPIDLGCIPYLKLPYIDESERVSRKGSYHMDDKIELVLLVFHKQCKIRFAR